MSADSWHEVQRLRREAEEYPAQDDALAAALLDAQASAMVARLRPVRRWVNRIARLLALVNPPREVGDFYRCDGRMVCPACGAIYFDHAQDPHEPWLEMLCNGDRVKL